MSDPRPVDGPGLGTAGRDPIDDPVAFPTLTPEQVDRVAAYGERSEVPAGTFLFEEGLLEYDFIVIDDGLAAVVRRTVDESVEIARHGSGRFLGELSLLTGQRTALAAHAVEDSVVIRVPPARFRDLMAAESDLSDVIFAALVARREVLRAGEGAGAIRILGSRYSRRSLELRSFARRQRLAHTWIDVDEDDSAEVDALLSSVGVRPRDLPVVVTPSAVLRKPTMGELSEHLGLSLRQERGHVYDLAIVGAGPAGLAAAVYGASEALDTVILDATAPGGQAGTSSRIENYFGFPAGVSGGDLVEAGALQATRLGAHINTPCTVVGVDPVEHGFTLGIGDDARLCSRSIIVAVGVRYRKLYLDRLADFEGAGVYYAATELEAQLCGTDPVVVIGGGNSAGQAAVFLATRGSSVTIAIRGPELAASMSTYLIDRIAAAPNIDVRTHTEVVELHGDDRLDAVTLRHDPPDGSSSTQHHPCVAVFSFTGAVPHTDWLAGRCELDERGFVLTDTDLPDEAQRKDALPFETSLPGVFAVGDARHGSMKRVAAAVGEGSSAVRSVHQHVTRA